MSPERREFLNLQTRPGRLNVEEAAWFLGFASHDIPILASAKMLKPLGNPPQNGTKYFAVVELEKLRSDPLWLAKASDALVKFWRKKNDKSS